MPRTILLIDDSATMRKLLRVYLMGTQYEFVEATSAVEGLDHLSKTPVDLVISDVRMDPMDGMAFTRALRQRESYTGRTPVILISSDDADDMRARAAMAGADGFLPKPLDGELLLSTVARLLRGRGDDASALATPASGVTPAHGVTPPAGINRPRVEPPRKVSAHSLPQSVPPDERGRKPT